MTLGLAALAFSQHERASMLLVLPRQHRADHQLDLEAINGSTMMQDEGRERILATVMPLARLFRNHSKKAAVISSALWLSSSGGRQKR